jgi:hypothetical protein
MPRDNVNYEENAKRDITWNTLIEDSEREINNCQERIRTLRKSLIFFKKQIGSGALFPVINTPRHKELS